MASLTQIASASDLMMSSREGMAIFVWSNPKTKILFLFVGAPKSEASRTIGPTMVHLAPSEEIALSSMGLFAGKAKPGTFSIKKNAGFTSATTRKNSRRRDRLGSSGDCLPMLLKPWQGGPPITPSTPFGSSSFRTLGVSDATSALRNRAFGKLVANELERIGSISTARDVLNPAFFEPKASPPQPEKRSRRVGIGHNPLKSEKDTQAHKACRSTRKARGDLPNTLSGRHYQPICIGREPQ